MGGLGASTRRPSTSLQPLRFSRHARNRLRHLGVRPADARAALADPRAIGEDDRGNVAVTAEVAGHTLTFIIAGDDPRFVITVIPRRS
ncbi:MAG: hypothetical protein AB7V62_17040 [Thermoleophilia bacterium]